MSDLLRTDWPCVSLIQVIDPKLSNYLCVCHLLFHNIQHSRLAKMEESNHSNILSVFRESLYTTGEGHTTNNEVVKHPATTGKTSRSGHRLYNYCLYTSRHPTLPEPGL